MTYIDDFTQNSDFYYDECNRGFTRLNQIIVSVASEELASWSRAYLIPTVYSYWERFFRNTLEEFSSALASSSLSLNSLNETLLARLKRREMKSILDKISLLQDTYLNSPSLNTITSDFSQLESLVQQFKVGNVFVNHPKKLVQTNSNVKFRVLCENFNYFGVNTLGMIKDFGGRGIQLNTKLDEFVDLRNDIGHGAIIAPLTKEKWNEYIDLVLTLMNLLQMTLLDALEGKEGHKIYSPQQMINILAAASTSATAATTTTLAVAVPITTPTTVTVELTPGEDVS